MDVGSDRDKFGFGTLVTAHIFQQVTRRNDGFGEFGAIGSCHGKSQDYFLDLIWKTIESRLSDFQVAIAGHYPDVSSFNLRPYMTKHACPNIISFFHLVFQSLRHDFVYSLYIALMTIACHYSGNGRDRLSTPVGVFGHVCVP